MDSNSLLNQIILDHNLDTSTIKIKAYHDCSIICTIWFISIYINNVKYCAQSTNKKIALNSAIKLIADDLSKNNITN